MILSRNRLLLNLIGDEATVNKGNEIVPSRRETKYSHRNFLILT